MNHIYLRISRRESPKNWSPNWSDLEFPPKTTLICQRTELWERHSRSYFRFFPAKTVIRLRVTSTIPTFLNPFFCKSIALVYLGLRWKESVEDVIPLASLRGACWSRDGFSSHRGRYVNVILFQFRSWIWLVCKVFHRCMECNITLRGSLWMVRRGRDYEVMCLHSLEPLKFL